MALALAEGHHHRVLDNDIVGPVSGGSVFDPLRRNEWTGNVIHGGGSADMVSLSILVEESLVDANRLVDAPGRFMVTSPWRSIIRYNEVKDMWRGSWANAEETYLQHGGANDGADWCPKTVGTASTATATTLTDASRKWKADVYRGGCVLITAGRGFGQWRRVTANDATTLTLAEPWRVVPDATSEYCVEKFFVENTYFANVNDTPGRLSLWLDCIGCLVDSHRDVFSGGLDVWGGENTSPQDVEHQPGKPNYYPSFYNHFSRCWLDGSPAWFYCDVRSDATPRGPMLFGNRMTECMANRAHAARTGFALQHAYSGAVSVGGHVPRDLADSAVRTRRPEPHDRGQQLAELDAGGRDGRPIRAEDLRRGQHVRRRRAAAARLGPADLFPGQHPPDTRPARPPPGAAGRRSQRAGSAKQREPLKVSHWPATSEHTFQRMPTESTAADGSPGMRRHVHHRQPEDLNTLEDQWPMARPR